MEKGISDYLSLENNKYMNIMVTIDSVGFINNEKPIIDFFCNIENRYPSRIVIEKYTLEGEPTFKIIEYNGERIKFVDDRSKTIDRYTKKYRGTKFERVEEEGMIIYNLVEHNKFVAKIIQYEL